MNFFGHAAVATWRESAPGFLLGAMLPDLCNMARAGPPEVAHDVVSAGVAMHHETDAIFHSAPTFLSLCSRFVRELTERGVGRGGARAVAHVGTELLLDGVLAERGGPREAYLEALEAAGVDRLGGELVFRDDAETDRFQHVRERLLQWGIPEDYADPGFVADRLVGMLRTRPRLALDDREQRAMRAWLTDVHPTVEAHTDALLRELRHGLGER